MQGEGKQWQGPNGRSHRSPSGALAGTAALIHTRPGRCVLREPPSRSLPAQQSPTAVISLVVSKRGLVDLEAARARGICSLLCNNFVPTNVQTTT